MSLFYFIYNYLVKESMEKFTALIGKINCLILGCKEEE